jgi:hypothetical protein
LFAFGIGLIWWGTLGQPFHGINYWDMISYSTLVVT